MSSTAQYFHYIFYRLPNKIHTVITYLRYKNTKLLRK